MKRAACIALSLLLLALAITPPALASAEKEYLINTISVLQPGDIPPTPYGIHHYLLISMDKWQHNPDNPGYNDGLILLTMDEVSGRVMVTSIIRDLLVIRPDGTPGRINRVVREYGVQGLMETINRHLGIQIDKYALMDWRHIMEIVDAAGGVNLHLTSDEAHYLKGWSVPVNSTQPVLSGAGDYHLNGFAAVIYMRIRRRRASNDLDTQDFGRTFRARTVLSGLAGNLRGYDMQAAEALLTNILTIWNQPFDKHYTYPGIRNNGIFTFGSLPKDPTTKRFATNLSMLDAADALRIAFLLKGSEVEQFRIPADGTVKPYIYAGGAGQLADFERNRQLLHEFMFPESFIVTDEGGGGISP